MPHGNAPLTETGRLRLARCVVEDGWTLRRAAERFQVSPTTAQRGAGRYRQLGEAGMTDRSSRPHHSPRRTPTRTERRIIKVRVLRRWGPARIAYLLGLNPATVHRVLPTGPGQDRISIPFFYNPALSARLPEVALPDELAAEARGVTDDERDALHAVYGENAFASRLRSHPNVAEKYYPELVGAQG